MQRDAWEHLLALKEWHIRTRQMTIDLSSGVRSVFRDVAPFFTSWEDRGSERSGDQNLDIVWQGRQITGRVAMRDFGGFFRNPSIATIESDQYDLDFRLLSSRPVAEPRLKIN